ncbi:acyl-CoA dehydrogenase [Bacteriovorax sp. Seq25_V]|uniref:acyl-CoA dehydrogenase n=1 Tax=Bacteriovorax sp. Seq25_V TaxID=1201288 RepID=UPI000389E02F|nr:acyl-CoA dehydrogenase [Bacteriovorax sp. Seq25_V]EQC47747.1 acyl-CoA dehydrogenase, C-terminal domain protein [Bacteriovorax sp. Seq25_V]
MLNTYHDKFEKLFDAKNSLKEDILSDDECSKYPSEASKYISNGVLSYLVPAGYGGSFENIFQTFCMGRALARRNVTTAIAVGQSFLGSLPIWISGNDDLKKRQAAVLLAGGSSCLALTELAHGSDLSSSECEVKDGKLLGTKWCINNATIGKAMTVICKDENALSLVFVDKSETSHFKNIEKIKTHGIRGADISGIEFDSYPVKDEDYVGSRFKALDTISKTMQISRTLCSSFSLGAADSTFRDTLIFSLDRELYGKKLIEMETVRGLLSKGLARILVCEAMALTATRMSSLKPELMALYSAVVKSFIPTQIGRQIDECKEILGARYYLRENDFPLFQKNLRDHSVVSLFDGSYGVNLSLLLPVIRKMRIYRTQKIESELASLNVNHSLKNLDFSKLKIGLRTSEFIIGEFFNFSDGGEYYTYNVLKERYLEIEERAEDIEINDSMLARDLAIEFTNIFACMNFMLFCHSNDVDSKFKSAAVVDQVIINILENSESIVFSTSYLLGFKDKLVSLFDLEINE